MRNPASSLWTIILCILYITCLWLGRRRACLASGHRPESDLRDCASYTTSNICARVRALRVSPKLEAVIKASPPGRQSGLVIHLRAGSVYPAPVRPVPALSARSL